MPLIYAADARRGPDLGGQNLGNSDVLSQTRTAVPIDVAPSVHGVPLMHGWIELDELNPTSYWASSADNDTR